MYERTNLSEKGDDYRGSHASLAGELKTGVLFLVVPDSAIQKQVQCGDDQDLSGCPCSDHGGFPG
jgi:hypothetical protein